MMCFFKCDFFRFLFFALIFFNLFSLVIVFGFYVVGLLIRINTLNFRSSKSELRIFWFNILIG